MDIRCSVKAVRSKRRLEQIHKGSGAAIGETCRKPREEGQRPRAAGPGPLPVPGFSPLATNST